jgi:methylated-DNA-[protein]-cysteine S-methyltransferase
MLNARYRRFAWGRAFVDPFHAILRPNVSRIRSEGAESMSASHRGRLESPVGTVEVTVNEGGAVVTVSFVEGPLPTGGTIDEACTRALRQLEEYFQGERRRFELPLEPEGTEFEHKVWNQVRRIPFGATNTYGEIARRLGADASSARAVGVANAGNPIAIIIPCHRVIGADGDLTGYAGGLDRKKWLLDMESGQQRLSF